VFGGLFACLVIYHEKEANSLLIKESFGGGGFKPRKNIISKAKSGGT